MNQGPIDAISRVRVYSRNTSAPRETLVTPAGRNSTRPTTSPFFATLMHVCRIPRCTHRAAFAAVKPLVRTRQITSPSAVPNMAAATATPIQDYIDRHGLQKKVEDVLNSCVKEKPADPLAFMVCSPG